MTPTNFLKPRHSEAIARIRTNGLGMVAALITTILLPLPSPWTAFRVAWASANGDVNRSAGTLWYGLCVAELLIFAVLSFNIMQAVYAIKYPPAALPPPPSLAKAKAVASTPNLSKSQRRLSGISTISPQTQKSFSSSTSTSSLYASSPLSTPSRIVHYSTPLDTSLLSSTGSPSPILNSPLAAYRGRHRTSVGRAFDGDLLNRLTQSTQEDDDD
ncbi:hypothetical protein NM688_g8358 [Phlebia brevispora]|uniref:Uncharacterized protein n=1 Tax=Phlebia brevispora TaxID=194682 RepID=A0ACC1RSM5_9APHY|nr:hypothetical protein NM688_g8358 [Phlebia brevispora]